MRQSTYRILHTPDPSLDSAFVCIRTSLTDFSLSFAPLQFFASIGSNDLAAFLACAASSTRTPRGPGSFEQIDWNEGRERWRKYKARYAFLRDREVTADPDACDATYLPHFGAVPGYREGAAFTDERGVKQHVMVRLRKEKVEWGKPKEWRVATVTWVPPKKDEKE